MGFKKGVALFSMIVTAKPGSNVFRIRHLKTQILVASNFGNVDRDLRMASCCRKERDKDYYIDCTHDRAVHDRSPSISPHDRIPMAVWPQGSSPTDLDSPHSSHQKMSSRLGGKFMKFR